MKRLAIAAGAAALSVTGSAFSAVSAPASMVVTATVVNACIVVAAPLVFGNYDPTSTSDTDGTSTVGVTCTTGTPYNVRIGPGGGSTVTARRMSFGSDTLPYALYLDSGHALNWGQTDTVDTKAGSSLGVLQNFTVYGRIPKNAASSPAGAYTDTVTVTVSY